MTSPPLLGRESECRSLRRLVEAVRQGESRSLVLRGEPGVGKTVLLEYLVERAAGCRVVRAAGVQSEMELPFAGLQQLCAPLLDGLDGLPAPQRDALRTAFGLSAGAAPDRFLVGLAVLGLFSAAAEEQPLVCAVDDAQWLDRASEQALAFVGRRLLAESVALVLTRRDEGSEPGLPELKIAGLRPEVAGALLNTAIHGPLDSRVRDQIVAETRGNPLALLELPRGMSPGELAGGFGLLDAPALGARIEESFQRRVDALPSESRLMLLVAAADPIGDPLLVRGAAGRLDLDVDAAGPATAAGLFEFELDARVRFRHPLVRSAVYRGASLPDRRRAHGALADATDAELDPERRAWHRAHAVTGPDEEVAAELERSAGHAQARGGAAAAAAFLDKAAALTPDAALRAVRQVTAAQAKLHAGAFEAALELLALADAGPLDELRRAQVDLLRAQVAFAVDRGRDAPQLLLDAARRLEPIDAALARETYLDALFAAMFADRLAGAADVPEVATRARPLPAVPESVPDLLLDALAATATESYAVAAPKLRLALDRFYEAPKDVWVRWVPHATQVALLLWDFDAWATLNQRRIQAARDDGALVALPLALATRIGAHIFAGELAAATALMQEVETVAEATATRQPSYGAVSLAAWRGRDLTLELVDRDAARGEGVSETIAQWADAVLYNGLGRYGEALAAAERAAEEPPGNQRTMVGIPSWALVELVEAAARSGQPDRAARALERLAERTLPSGSDWARGLEARSRALVSEGAAAERLYRDALSYLDRAGVGAYRARTHLIYGEWLRRAGRRVDARAQLRAAHEQFVAMGFDAFAARAEGELRAAGAAAGARGAAVSGVLTAQEAQVARLARNGLSNADIGARLFISPRTVQYHLHKVFAKLGINSRSQLTGVLAADHA